MSDVFFSYKRENLAAVNRLVEALRAEGVGVWWDQDIPPNAPWEATIERALAQARLVVVAWSPASVASENVKAEARWARQQGRLLQVFVEACQPPLFFGERQGLDMKAWSGAPADPTFRSLVAAVRQGLAPSAAPVQEAVASPRAAAALPLPSKPSVAVMPFSDMSGAKDQDYFASGMAAEIITALTRFRSLFVIASDSSFSYRNEGRSPKIIGQELGVRYLLEGSVRRSGERVRIAVQLVDVAEGVQIWAEKFDGVLEDVFALQDTVANAVAGQIEPSVVAAEIRRANSRPTSDLSAYELYLQARQLMFRFDRRLYPQAIDLLVKTIDLDPDYALALALACYLHGVISLFGSRGRLDPGHGPSQDGEAARRTCLALGHRALQCGHDDAEALAWVAYTFVLIGEDIGVLDSLTDRALMLNPGLSMAWLASGAAKLCSGKSSLAVDHLEAGMRLDPRSPFLAGFQVFLGDCLFMLHRFAEAIPLFKETVQRLPGPSGPTVMLAACYAHLGRVDEAKELLRSSTSEMFDLVLGWFRDADDRELLRSGLALAGADV